MPSLRRAAIVAAAAGVTLGAGTLTAVAPATAAQLDGVCNATELCMHPNSYWNGSRYDTRTSNANYNGDHYYNSSISLNDTVSSVHNKTEWRLAQWTDSCYRGYKMDLKSGWYYENLGGTWANDALSSHAGFYTTC